MLKTRTLRHGFGVTQGCQILDMSQVQCKTALVGG
jgi:hypothetical protein